MILLFRFLFITRDKYMSNVVVGSIPKKICYVFSDEIDAAVGCNWDINWTNNEENDSSKSLKEKVLPAFPTEDGNEKTLKTAKAWAEQTNYGQKQKVSKTEVVDNDPIKNIRIFSLEERGQGGRAYKVLAGKYYLDLREDVMMDTLLNV